MTGRGNPERADSADESGSWLNSASASAITPAFRRPAERAAVAAVKCSISTLNPSKFRPAGHAPVAAAEKESQMPKLKTKSGAKKRFKVTGGGKVLYQQSRKRHGMIKRTKKQIRQLRGTNVLFKTDGDKIKKYFLPNA
jgi:large subunit ribosomal protein L35